MYIELKNINKTFGDVKASDNVSFGIEKGRLIGLLGPSGSGKTTILRMLAGLEKQDSGDIFIDGKNVNDLSPDQRGIGFVFQNYALFPYLTVFDNIAYGLKIQKKEKEYIKNRVKELLELVGLPGVEKRYPDQLSGGQRQRIALARALAPSTSRSPSFRMDTSKRVSPWILWNTCSSNDFLNGLTNHLPACTISPVRMMASGFRIEA